MAQACQRNAELPLLTCCKLHLFVRYHYIYASELRSRSGCGRPRVGVGGLWMLSSCKSIRNVEYHTSRSKDVDFTSKTNSQLKHDFLNTTSLATCIHVSSMTRSGDVSGDWRGGGKGWINLGTTTNPLPTTSIAPALFAVPTFIHHMRLRIICTWKGETPKQFHLPQ